MPGGGGTTSTTTVQNADPWRPAQDSLKAALGRNQNLWEADKTGDRMFASEHPLQSLAEHQALTRANSGDGVAASMAGQGFVTDVLNNPSAAFSEAQGIASDVGSASPYAGTDDLFANISSRVMPAVNAQFGGSGRTGSGLHADTMTRAMTESFAPTAAALYENDQTRRLSSAGMLGSFADAGLQRGAQAAALAPTVDNATFADLDRMQSIGTARRAEQQFELDRPWMALDRMRGAAQQIGGLGGTTFSQGQVPNQSPSPFQTATGLGLSALPFFL